MSRLTFHLVSISEISYNRPSICRDAFWILDNQTISNQTIMNINIWDFFIDTNNTVYVSTNSSSAIQFWLEDGQTGSRIMNNNVSNISSFFITEKGEIYFHTTSANVSRVEQWMPNGSVSTVMYVNGTCVSLFVDIFGSIYCSLADQNQVIKKEFNNHPNSSSVIAGNDNGTNGSASDMLHNPRSIFVTDELNLYVADCGNNRVLFFKNRERTGTSVLGNGTIQLNCPTGLAMDRDENLYVTDNNNQRIIRSWFNGMQCIIGCDLNSNSMSNYISPPSLRFDSYGNIYSVNSTTNRIEKYLLDNTTCHGKIRRQLS